MKKIKVITKTKTLRWRVCLTQLFAETINCNKSTWILKHPYLITDSILNEVAARCIKINDPELNALMLRLGLYSISDPNSPDFDLKKSSELIDKFYSEIGK